MKAMMNSQEYASETDLLQWESIDWKLMEEKIRTLQARIVKAQKAGKHRKVRSLQWILTRSYAAKVLAVKGGKFFTAHAKTVTTEAIDALLEMLAQWRNSGEVKTIETETGTLYIKK